MDKKKKIELEVLNISNSQEQAGAYALVLGEVEGTRQLPVIIGGSAGNANQPERDYSTTPLDS